MPVARRRLGLRKEWWVAALGAIGLLVSAPVQGEPVTGDRASLEARVARVRAALATHEADPAADDSGLAQWFNWNNWPNWNNWNNWVNWPNWGNWGNWHNF